MASIAELVQNMIETVDNASSQRLHLSELLDCLQETKQQVSMASTAELVQNVIGIVENASSQRLHLSELLDCLQEAKQQVSMVYC